MAWIRFAWVIVVLSALAAASSILASIFGEPAILLSILTAIFSVAGARVTYKLQAKQRSKRNAALLERFRKENMEREAKLQVERQKELALDRDCADLLRRAREAVKVVLASDACKHDLLEPPVNETVLGDNIREIFAAGKEMTAIRAEINSIIIDSSSEMDAEGRHLAGPMTSAHIQPQRQHLANVMDSATMRVTQLEYYAKTVKAVDVTYKDWIGAQRAERLNGRILELAAKMEADRLAAEELERLAENTAAAEQIFRRSVAVANLAAETLAPPVEK